MTNSRLRDSLYRDAAPVPSFNFLHRDNLAATYQTSTAILIQLNKISTMTAKTRAIPSLHRDYFAGLRDNSLPGAFVG